MQKWQAVHTETGLVLLGNRGLGETEHEQLLAIIGNKNWLNFCGYPPKTLEFIILKLQHSNNWWGCSEKIYLAFERVSEQESFGLWETIKADVPRVFASDIGSPYPPGSQFGKANK